MRDAREPRTLFFVIFLCAAVLAVHDYPLIPDRVASHFSASGAANAWMSKPLFFAFYAGAVVIAFVVEFFVPRTLANSPKSRMNLPNKEYWLAPNRRDKTIGYLQRRFAWYGCAFLGLEVCAMEMAIRANMRAEPELPLGPVLLLLGAFLAFNVIWMVGMFRHFAKTETN
jgi:uncharacterized membrane protein